MLSLVRIANGKVHSEMLQTTDNLEQATSLHAWHNLQMYVTKPYRAILALTTCENIIILTERFLVVIPYLSPCPLCREGREHLLP